MSPTNQKKCRKSINCLLLSCSCGGVQGKGGQGQQPMRVQSSNDVIAPRLGREMSGTVENKSCVRDKPGIGEVSSWGPVVGSVQHIQPLGCRCRQQSKYPPTQDQSIVDTIEANTYTALTKRDQSSMNQWRNQRAWSASLYCSCLTLMSIFTSIFCVEGSIECRTYPFRNIADHIPLSLSNPYNWSEYWILPNAMSKESLSLNRDWCALVAYSSLAIPKDEELHGHHRDRLTTWRWTNDFI